MAADWNPELSTRYRTDRAIGRPRKRWEDDINEFLKQLKILKIQLKSNNQTNKTWVSIAKDRGNWAPQKKLTQMTAEGTTGDEEQEKMIKADQRNNLMGETE